MMRGEAPAHRHDMEAPCVIMSDCGQYRYCLRRPPSGDACETSTHAPALFIMLNPSTADATSDDPTLRRCRAFARDWGCGGVIVANLYALRSTHPAGLWLHGDPVGPENDAYLYELAAASGEAICAWGDHARPARVAAVLRVLREAGATLWCLGTTMRGAPRHPLYVRRDQGRVEWVAAPDLN